MCTQEKARKYIYGRPHRTKTKNQTIINCCRGSMTQVSIYSFFCSRTNLMEWNAYTYTFFAKMCKENIIIFPGIIHQSCKGSPLVVSKEDFFFTDS